MTQITDAYVLFQPVFFSDVVRYKAVKFRGKLAKLVHHNDY